MFANVRASAALRVFSAVVVAAAALVGVAGLLPSAAASTRAATPPAAPPFDVTAQAVVTLDKFIYLPFLSSAAASNACQPITTESYGTLSVNPPPTDRPAEQHADLNLGWRTYTPTIATLGLVNIGGPADSAAPQFPGLFGDNRTPQFSSSAQVYNWSWACNCRTTPITQPPVTLLGMVTAPGEIIHAPDSGYRIGSGYEVLVLYAAPTRITLKYTREDNVIQGYTIHLENVCVEPNLLALYQTSNSNGRGQLPALRAGQGFGRASGAEIAVAIQDSGAWLEPRSRKDWWQGR
jgi:hypothetical protein